MAIVKAHGYRPQPGAGPASAGQRISDLPDALATGTRVLITDDDWASARTLAEELQQRGLLVALASSQHEALARLRESGFDLALIEPQLPGTNWLRVLRELRACAPDIRLLVLTSFPSFAMAVQAMKLGALDVLRKPTTIQQVAGALGGVPASLAEPGRDFTLAGREWEHINEVLRICDGNVARTARVLRVSRQTLYSKLKKHPPP
jgi:two-component system response regulator RegA